MKRKITNTYTNSTSDMKNKKKRILNIVSFDNLQKENNSQMITENNKPNTTKNHLSRSWNNMEVKNTIMNVNGGVPFFKTDKLNFRTSFCVNTKKEKGALSNNVVKSRKGYGVCSWFNETTTYGNQSSSLFEMNKANESLRMEKRTPKFSEIIN